MLRISELERNNKEMQTQLDEVRDLEAEIHSSKDNATEIAEIIEQFESLKSERDRMALQVYSEREKRTTAPPVYKWSGEYCACVDCPFWIYCHADKTFERRERLVDTKTRERRSRAGLELPFRNQCPQTRECPAQSTIECLLSPNQAEYG